MECKYADTEPVLEPSQATRERAPGPEYLDVVQSLSNRAWVLSICSPAFRVIMSVFHLYTGSQGKLEEAGLLYDRSLAIREKTLGPDHPDVAQSLNNRALLLESQVRVIENSS